VATESSVVFSISLKRSDHPFCSLDNTKGVFQSAMDGAWINVMRHAELPNAPEPLE